MFDKSIYKIKESSYFNIHILLNNYCNNRCVYCGQYDKYGTSEIELDRFKRIVLFFKKGLPAESFNFVLEGGEPSFHKELHSILHFFNEINLRNKVIILTNGRIQRNKINLFKYYLANETIDSIAIHAPLGKEPFHKEWLSDIITFLEFLKTSNFNKRISLIGIIHNKSSARFLTTLLNLGSRYSQLISTIEPGLAHPSLEHRFYLKYQERLEIMNDLYDFFSVANEKGLVAGLGGFMLCLLDSIENTDNKEILHNLYRGKLEMNRNIELHIVFDGSGYITLPISDTADSYIKLQSIFDFDNFDLYLHYINNKLRDLYNRNYQKMPSTCKDNCQHYGKGCNGDHFKLITEYNANYER